MPDKSTVFRWLAINEAFRDQYARAREVQADALVDEILEISDDGTNDWMERKNSDDQGVGWVLNGEHVQRSRLRVDSRKWFASKVAPKKYGDKLQTEISGPGGGPIKTETAPNLENLTKEQRAQLRGILSAVTGESESDVATP